jgi:hypothetical protein
VNGRRNQLFAGPGLPRYVNRVIRSRKVPDLLVYVEHLAVPAYNSRKARKLAEAKLKADHLRQIAESGQNTDKGAGLIIHARYRHLDPARIARPGSRVYNVGVVSQAIGGLAAKGAFAPAKRPSENGVAIASERFFARIPRDLFSGPVEKKHPPVEVVGNYALHQVIQHILEILLPGDKIFEAYGHRSVFSF